MGMVFRVLFNNKNWRAPCENPGKDRLCSPCFNPKVKIRPPKPDDQECSSSPPCWEQQLCESYEWGATRDKKFSKRTYPGMKVFFVFKQPDSKYYTLWGRTTIDSVNVPPIGNKAESVEKGYTQYVRFSPFQPLPSEKWVENLTDSDLTGDKPWLMGRYRYITAEKEAYLESIIEGFVPEKSDQGSEVALTRGDVVLTVVITSTMSGRLESAATEEGRRVDEVVREAIAEWLIGRRE